jgi:hypothetical protein
MRAYMTDGKTLMQALAICVEPESHAAAMNIACGESPNRISTTGRGELPNECDGGMSEGQD